MYTIEFDPDYEQELEFILTGIVLDYTVAYAEKIVAIIDNTIQTLKHQPNQPKLFAIYANIPMYRKFLIDGKYAIFYIVNDDTKTVRIVHIFSCCSRLVLSFTITLNNQKPQSTSFCHLWGFGVVFWLKLPRYHTIQYHQANSPVLTTSSCTPHLANCGMSCSSCVAISSLCIPAPTSTCQ